MKFLIQQQKLRQRYLSLLAETKKQTSCITVPKAAAPVKFCAQIAFGTMRYTAGSYYCKKLTVLCHSNQFWLLRKSVSELHDDGNYVQYQDNPADDFGCLRVSVPFITGSKDFFRFACPVDGDRSQDDSKAEEANDGRSESVFGCLDSFFFLCGL